MEIHIMNYGCIKRGTTLRQVKGVYSCNLRYVKGIFIIKMGTQANMSNEGSKQIFIKIPSN